MSPYKRTTNRLDSLLSGLEKIVLESRGEEILVTEKVPSVAADVRALIEQQIHRHGESMNSTAKESRKRVGKIDVKPALTVPRDIAGRLKLLRKLLTTRPDLPMRVSSAFSGGRKLSNREVNELTEELLRLGMLRTRRRG